MIKIAARHALLLALVGAAACHEPMTAAFPRCLQPAPLLGHLDPAAPGIIVEYQSGVDAVSETARLAAKWKFTPKFVYSSAIQGFAATVPATTIEALRCEPTIKLVEYDQLLHAD